MKRRITQLTRWLTRWAWIHERNVCEGIATIQELHMEPGAMELKIKQQPELARWIALCFAQLIVNSPNYTEATFDLVAKHTAEKWEWIAVTVVKGNGKTPHQLKVEAEQERDKLKSQLNVAQQHTTCARCRVDKHTPVRRDPDGYICAGCLEKEADNYRKAILRIANECNCRAEHGADGAEHLLAIEKMLRSSL